MTVVSEHRTPPRRSFAPAELTRKDNGHETTGVYLREIGRTPLLTAIEEVELASMIEAGLYAQHLLDHPELARPAKASKANLKIVATAGVAARQQMIEANLRLVVGVARRYLWSGITLLDLMQEGNLGLIRAVEKFDYTRGYKFSTYGVSWIRQAVGRAVETKARAIKLPIERSRAHERARVAGLALEEKLGRRPTDTEVGAELGVDAAAIREYRREARDVVGLDAPVGSGGGDDPSGVTFGDYLIDRASVSAIEDVEAAADARIVARTLDEALARLPARHAKVLRRRFGYGTGEPATIAQVGKELGVTQKGVTHEEEAALAALRVMPLIIDLAHSEGLRYIA